MRTPLRSPLVSWAVQFSSPSHEKLRWNKIRALPLADIVEFQRRWANKPALESLPRFFREAASSRYRAVNAAPPWTHLGIHVSPGGRWMYRGYQGTEESNEGEFAPTSLNVLVTNPSSIGHPFVASVSPAYRTRYIDGGTLFAEASPAMPSSATPRIFIKC